MLNLVNIFIYSRFFEIKSETGSDINNRVAISSTSTAVTTAMPVDQGSMPHFSGADFTGITEVYNYHGHETRRVVSMDFRKK